MIDYSTVSLISSKIAQMYDEDKNNDISEASIDLSSRDTSSFNGYLEDALIEILDEDDYEVTSFVSERDFMIIQIGELYFSINYLNSNDIQIKKVNMTNDYDNHISDISREINQILMSPEILTSIEIENPHFNLLKTDKVSESLKAILGVTDITCGGYRWQDKYKFIIKIGESYITVSYLKSSVINSEKIKIIISKECF